MKMLLMTVILFSLTFYSCEDIINSEKNVKKEEFGFKNFEYINSKHWKMISYKSAAGVEIKLKDLASHYPDLFLLQFHNESIFYGVSGCNSYSGAYEVEENNISFSNFYSTKVNCRLTSEYESSLIRAKKWKYNEKDSIFTVLSPSNAVMIEINFEQVNFDSIRYEEENISIDINTDQRIDVSIKDKIIIDYGDTLYRSIQARAIHSKVGSFSVDKNSVIDNDLDFTNQFTDLAVKDYEKGLFDEFWQGDFVSDSGSYLPLKYVFSDDTYFGWLQIEIDRKTGETEVLDLALQNIPEKAIRAGKKP